MIFSKKQRFDVTEGRTALSSVVLHSVQFPQLTLCWRVAETKAKLYGTCVCHLSALWLSGRKNLFTFVRGAAEGRIRIVDKKNCSFQGEVRTSFSSFEEELTVLTEKITSLITFDIVVIACAWGRDEIERDNSRLCQQRVISTSSSLYVQIEKHFHTLPSDRALFVQCK